MRRGAFCSTLQELHHEVPGVSAAPFDAATWSADGKLLYLISRAPDGTKGWEGASAPRS